MKPTSYDPATSLPELPDPHVLVARVVELERTNVTFQAWLGELNAKLLAYEARDRLAEERARQIEDQAVFQAVFQARKTINDLLRSGAGSYLIDRAREHLKELETCRDKREEKARMLLLELDARQREERKDREVGRGVVVAHVAAGRGWVERFFDWLFGWDTASPVRTVSIPAKSLP